MHSHGRKQFIIDNTGTRKHNGTVQKLRNKKVVSTISDVRLKQEHEEKSSFLAFRSDSQMLVDTQKLVTPQQFILNTPEPM